LAYGCLSAEISTASASQDETCPALSGAISPTNLIGEREMCKRYLQELTNEQLRERGEQTRIDQHTYSYLSLTEYKALKKAMAIAYPHDSRETLQRRTQGQACRPVQALALINRVTAETKQD
jgi:hypothetical protein